MNHSNSYSSENICSYPQPEFIKLNRANRKNQIWILCSVLVILGMSIIFSVREDGSIYLPLKTAPPIPQTCMMKHLFKIDCPACGLTRSIINYSHGNFYEGWRYHRVGILIYLLIILQIPYRTYVLITGKSVAFFVDSRFIQILSYSLIFLFVLNWIFNLITENMTP